MSQNNSASESRAGHGERLEGRSVCLLSSANWDVLLRRLSEVCSAGTGRPLEWRSPPFGQYRILLNDPASELRQPGFDYYLFAERLEDFAPPFKTLDSSASAGIRERFTEYLADIRNFRRVAKGRFLINNFAPVRPFSATIAEQAGQEAGVDRLTIELNAELAEFARTLPDTQIVPLSAVVADLGRRACDPGKYWLIGRVPFARAIIEPYARLVAGIMLATSGRTSRALAIDLDNTLWGGVVGDDGLENLTLGTDYPGNQFLAVQELLQSLGRRGLVLTLVSKNTEAVALEAIRSHPAMVLKEGDFVARQINWEPKSVNIDALARELDLGTSSFMLIDDNPVERAEVAGVVPGIVVPDLPNDPSEWPRLLLTHPALTALSLSAEDLNRKRSYEVRRDIRAADARPGGREAFLHSLGLSLGIRTLDPRNQLRVNQLLSKTNQYNTTGRRYSELDLKQLGAAGNDVLSLRVTDKHGSDEIVGAAVVRYEPDVRRGVIDNFVMSCRLLGRGVETAALSVISQRAIARGCRRLVGEINQTPRNEPCRRLYSDHGFADLGDGKFELDLATPVKCPPWFAIEHADADRS